MDAMSDPRVDTVVIMSSAQVGKTEIINNAVGYYIDQDPSPILVIQPTLEMGQAWSKDRLAPMLRDSPCLQGKVIDPKTRDSENTILHKIFKGGHITISGANSPASLASRPIRIVLCDEIDRYPVSAGAEGDPVDLATKRSTTFWNRKRLLCSTPTIAGASRIEMAYKDSDQRHFYVPCPHCGEYQPLKWENLRWDKNGDEHLPDTAAYYCDHCGTAITDADKFRMLRKGEWRPHAAFHGTAGFHLNELYSPWVRFAQMAAAFLKARATRQTLKTFTNTSLGEVWDENYGERIDEGPLMARREKYAAQIPAGAAVLTAGVDVQADRLEVKVKGWGKPTANPESWLVDRAVFRGDPAKDTVWKELDEYLLREWEHEGGLKLRIAVTMIDSGGKAGHTQRVYSFVMPRQMRRVYASKGSNQAGQPIIGKVVSSYKTTPKAKGKLLLYHIGTDTAKDLIMGRLKLEEFGPGYMHFPDSCDEEYFKQLTAEKVVLEKGRRVWKKTRARNEALDIEVLCIAGLMTLNANLEKISDRIAAKVETKEDKPEGEDPAEKKPAPQRKRNWVTGRGNWATRWKR